MKNIFTLAIIFALFANIQTNSQSEKTQLAQRYIKLANTYLNADEINDAIAFLNKADEALKRQSGWEAEYWRAAADETYGVAFAKMKINDEARKYFQSALDRYQKLITMDKGSQEAVELLVANIDALMNNNHNHSFSSYSSSTVAGLSVDANVLNYDNLKLRALPNDIPAKVINISLANNNLRDFPVGLSAYKNLKYINLANNRITKLDAGFSGMTGVVWLNLSGNKIKSIQPGISALGNLEFLDLSNNRLKDIPADFIALKKVKVINLKGNRIPFARIKNLLQSMPNTNILHDEYINKEEEEFDEFED